MKLKNVRVGQTVKIRKSNDHFNPSNVGKTGIVIGVEHAHYTGRLSVRLQLGAIS